jgi:hypothetical protein
MHLGATTLGECGMSLESLLCVGDRIVREVEYLPLFGKHALLEIEVLAGTFLNVFCSLMIWLHIDSQFVERDYLGTCF